ncbi:hypothetical protein [Agilicoccus flavus]|uniref:hypothetical protein n=1 Tax=Agilicoccus flavus TaxID=2775968 RepID=UPI001CF716D3|nr:hypothetical protein [Agilicoccus flavus]
MRNITRIRTTSPATLIRVLVVVLAMLAVSAMTLQRSQSAFSGTTTYGDSGSVGAARVSLGSKADRPLDVSDLVPGDTIVRCVDVTYDGTATADQLDSLRLYGADPSGGALGQYLGLVVEAGADGTTCASTGTWSTAMSGKLNAVLGAQSTYGTAANTGWTPAAAGAKRPFRFTVTLDSSTPNEAQGTAAKPMFTWEIRTRPGTSR